MILRRFFVPETPAGYWPGDLIARIAERDLTQMEHKNDGQPGKLECQAGTITVREHVKRDFLQFTAIPIFEIGEPRGDSSAQIVHTGTLKRTGIKITGDEALAAPLRTEGVSKVLMGLDFTRLEVFGCPESFRLEIETYGGTQVVMRIPHVRRYIPMGEEQSALLVSAVEVISQAYDEQVAQKGDA